MAGVRPDAARLWPGLGRSPFIQDVRDDQRDPGRLLVGIIGGGLAGLVADAAARILVAAVFTLAVGRGREGLEGLGRILKLAESSAGSDVSLNLLALLVAAGGDGAFALTFVAFAAFLAHRPLHGYVTSARQIRWRLLGVGLVFSLLALAPVAAADSYLSGETAAPPILSVAADWGPRLIYAASALLLVPMAAAEELIFRGWLLRQTAAFTRRPGLLVGFTAVLFSAAHLDFSAEGFLTLALMGAGLAYMTLRLGGIELACAAHAANNMVIVLFLQPFTAEATESRGSGLTAGSLASDAGLVLGYVAIAELIARVSALRRWAGVDPTELSPVV